MSEPIEQFDNHIITDGDMSGDVTSSLTTLDSVSLFAVQNSWRGTPTGTLYVEVRNDASMPWTTLNSTSLTGSAGDEMVNVDVAGFRFAQVRYAYTSGTGTLNSFINGKNRS